jgi:predicted ATPase/DNA-binding CsgD family transcriptional regulator
VKEAVLTSDEQRIAALPEETTSFIGREAELAEGRLLLGRSRLVTLTGTGGVGKTRIARLLAQSVARNFHGRAWFVELDLVMAGSEIADVVASALQIQASGQNSLDAVATYIGDNEVLLVLDNCEHVLAASSALVRILLAECPNATILTTSRERLDLTHEAILQIEPFEVSASGEKGPVQDAVQLFVERARSSVPDYDPAVPELQIIAKICARLEGLPLAIELAAVRIRVASPRQILDRLERPWAFLSRKNMDLPARQRTLHASIEWSYELCTPDERWLWARLSVFAGIWDLDAAAAITASSGRDRDTVVDLLQSLIEKSLVVGHHESGVHWYGMLTSIREFGRDTLAEGNAVRVARREHCAWYLRRLHQAETEWIGPDQARWLRFFLRELPNLRAALEFSLSDGDAQAALQLTTIAWRVSWQAIGRIDEHRHWLTRALRASTAPTSDRAQALTLDAVLAMAQGDHEIAASEITEAQAIAHTLDDPLLHAIVASGQAELLTDSPAALALREQAAHFQTDHPFLAARLNAPTRLAMMYARNGDIVNATRWHESFLRISETTGERYESSYLLRESGAIALQRNDPETGRDLLRQSLSLTSDLTSLPGIGRTHELLARAAVMDRHFERAASLLGAAHTAWRIAGGLPYQVPEILGNREDTTRTANLMLGEQAFSRAFSRGRDLTVDEGIALALGGSEPVATVPEIEDTGRHSHDSANLTRRELQVAELVAGALSDKQIAARLFISQRTAEGHVQNALVKLGFTSRTQLAVWVTQSSQERGSA